MKAGLAALLALCVLAPVRADTPLPQPLGLQQALELAGEQDPELRLRAAAHARALAARERVRSGTATRARLVADGRWVQPSTEAGGDLGGAGSELTSPDDSRLHLIVSRRLWDFGRQRAGLEAAEAETEAGRVRLAAQRAALRLDVTRDFLDVLLADLAFAAADEAMAIAYVRLERVEDRHRLGQVSDLALLEQRERYQRLRLARYRAESRQRLARARLAETLGRPGELPAELLAPELPARFPDPPELSAWEARALEHNPRLRALRAEVAAARARLRAARAESRPVLSGELRASAWAREYSTRDALRAGLLLDVPLYTGGRVAALRADARAQLEAALAREEAARRDVRQALREAHERLTLLRVRHEQARAERDLQELRLDRARTLYDMEAVADLGDAMADFSSARLRETEARYQSLLTWGEVALLLGELDWRPPGIPAVAP